MASVETVDTLDVSPTGLRKVTTAPVLVLLGPVRAGASLSCDWVFTHRGLIPGPYELRDGTTINVPPWLCSRDGRAVHTATLEVIT